MSNLSAIDIGFWRNKGIINGKPVKFKSVVGNEVKQKFKDLDMSNQKDLDSIIVKRNNENYFVSDLAITQSEVVDHSLKPNRFNFDSTRVIVDAMFALGLGGGNHQTYLVSGLPVSHYETYKDEIRKLFLGDSEVHQMIGYDVVNFGNHIRGNVSIVSARFVPQPFGALVNKILDDNGNISDRQLATKTVAVVDIGFGTTDVYVSNSLKPIDRLTFSNNIAMNMAYRLISNKLEEQFGIQVPLYVVESICKSGKWKDNPVADIIKWSYQRVADQIVNSIYNKLNTDFGLIDVFLLAGGGGNALGEYMTEIPFAETLGDMAVVEGYYKWGKRTWKIGGEESEQAIYVPNNSQNTMA